MTVQSGPTEKRYVANGVTTAFTVPFLLLYADDLKVVLNGTLITSGFVISGIGAAQGTITFDVAPVGDLFIYLDVPFERLIDYQENGDFLSTTVNRDFDRIWQALKQLLRFSGRALTLGVSDIDGKGSYRANGNRIQDLGEPLQGQDAVTRNWATQFIANILNTGQGPANNAKNVLYADVYGAITTVADALDGVDTFTHIYDVLVAYGQSNALGLAGLSGDTSGFPQMLPTSLMYDPVSGQIKPMIQGMRSVNGETSTGHAWGEFANEYYRRTKRGLIVVNAARGGMSIATLSKGNASGYYAKMIDGANAAVTAAVNMGLTVGNRLVCWHQGETDQQNDTSFEEYRNALENMVTNINTDWPISLFGICTVGSPLSRKENTWAQIQNAQRYFAGTNPKAAIVFDGCPTFSITDGIINASGTDEHYSQKGYNLMGYHAAQGFASVLDRASRVKSPDELAEYGGRGKVGPAWARAERVSGHGFYRDGLWRLSSKDMNSNDFRTAGVGSISANDNTIRVKLSNRADYMFETHVKVSQVGIMCGIVPHISRTIVGTEFYLDLNFYIDLRIVASLSSGGLFFGRPIAALPFWLSSFVTASLNGGVLTLSHGATSQAPMVSHNGGGGALNGQPAAVYAAAPTATTTIVSFGTGAQPANPAINIGIDRMLIPHAALALLPGFAFEFAATIAPRS